MYQGKWRCKTSLDLSISPLVLALLGWGDVTFPGHGGPVQVFFQNALIGDGA